MTLDLIPAAIVTVIISLFSSGQDGPATTQFESMTSRQINEALLLMPDNQRDLRRLMRRYRDLEFRDVHVTMNMTVDARRRAGFLCGYVRGEDSAGTYSEWIQFFVRRGTAVLGTENPRMLDATCNSTVVQDPVDRSSLFAADAAER